MSVIERQIQGHWQLRVFFTENVFAPENAVLRDALADGAPRQALVVLEDSLAQAMPSLETQIQNYFSAHAGQLRLMRAPLLACGGERVKNSTTLVGELYSQLHRHHADRHSFLIAIGGGALLDVAAFAGATAHGGMRLVRIPTTTLSQTNSGVFLKNGLNAFGRKNFIGTFAPPFAVFNDFNLLATLRPREKRSGYAEAVKVACACDGGFFDELERDVEKLSAFDPAAMKRLIRRGAELHLNHFPANGYPFQSALASPLEFGHWAAHKLEQLSHFGISHGEALAIGIALDAICSREMRLLGAPSATRILNLLEKLGFRLFADELLNADNSDLPAVLSGMQEFREQMGGELSIPLLGDIGHCVQADEVNPRAIVAAIRELQQRCQK